MKKSLLIILAIGLMLLPGSKVLAIECENDPPSGDANALIEYQKDCEQKIGELQSQAKTLKAAISLLNSQINLTLAQIKSTASQIETLEQEIQALGGVIEDLNLTLEDLTEIYISRLRQSYKDRNSSPLVMLFAADTFNNFQNKIKYLTLASKRDQIIIYELETSRLNLDAQKTSKEEKQLEIENLQAKLESQGQVLAAQQTQKQTLLTDTNNSESRYQQFLAKAVAELAAIESIIAGRGSEVEVGQISAGEKIASIIPGASACSTGAHLHFEVVKDKSHQNPANYLSSKDIIWSNSPDGAFGFNGSWNWPLNDPIRITQGYGHTAYSSRYANDQHTGIDMTSNPSYEVKSVQNGTLFRGSIACGGGTLKYVHVKHEGDGLDTYYLHVNYF
jgi:peptidoglycan hydrolase CwlO-like protein